LLCTKKNGKNIAGMDTRAEIIQQFLRLGWMIYPTVFGFRILPSPEWKFSRLYNSFLSCKKLQMDKMYNNIICLVFK
jgi:hypothetical protein